MFAPTSRYQGVPEAVISDAQGRSVRYKLMRRIPATAELQTLHMVSDTDRLDLVSYRYYGDPELFWRICDANRAMVPADLVAVPRRLLLVPQPR
jgi:hypothetical protein